MIRERQVTAVSGGLVLLVLLAAGVGLMAGLMANVDSPEVVVACMVGLVLVIVCLCGLFIVNPNEAKVLQLFGRYVGTVREPGLRWASPFYPKRKVSVRIRNFESNKLKVNDHDGSPIEIAAVVVWRVVDTAEAAFEVDNYEDFVHVSPRPPSATWPPGTATTPTTPPPSACAATRRRWPTSSSARFRTAWRRRAWKSSRRASRTWRTRRRSPRRCSAASRPGP